MQSVVPEPQGSITRHVAAKATREILDGYLAALLSGESLGGFLADDVTLTLMDTGEVTRGRDAVIGLITFLHQQAFTATPVVRAIVAGEHQATLEAEFVGTHIGEFAGIAPTGRSVRLPYAVGYDFVDGRIVALRIYLPMDVLVRQLRD
jgi:ketosteroid isomerase-like protein